MMSRKYNNAVIWGITSLLFSLLSLYVFSNADEHLGEYIIYILTLLCTGTFIGTLVPETNEKLSRFFETLRKVSRTVLIVFAAGLIFLLVVCRSDKVSYNEKYAVVLGAPIRETKISSVLINRVETAADYLRKNKNAVAVLTGGNSPYEDYSGLVSKMTTEGAFMAMALMNEDIDPDRLYVEDKATTTEENFEYSIDILRDAGYHDGETVVIITSLFHTFRVRTLAKEAGIDNCLVYASVTHPLDVISWYVREIPISILFFIQHNILGIFSS